VRERDRKKTRARAGGRARRVRDCAARTGGLGPRPPRRLRPPMERWRFWPHARHKWAIGTSGRASVRGGQKRASASARRALSRPRPSLPSPPSSSRLAHGLARLVQQVLAPLVRQDELGGGHGWWCVWGEVCGNGGRARARLPLYLPGERERGLAGVSARRAAVVSDRNADAKKKVALGAANASRVVWRHIQDIPWSRGSAAFLATPFPSCGREGRASSCVCAPRVFFSSCARRRRQCPPGAACWRRPGWLPCCCWRARPWWRPGM
jgi:hypothetical protein